MKTPASVPVIVFFILTGLFSDCSDSGKQETKTSENKKTPEKTLAMQLQAFDNFNRAEPFYQVGIQGADSAAWFYRELLKEDLDNNQKLLIYNRLGYVENIRGNVDDAYDLFRKSTSLIHRISTENLKMVGVAYSYMGAIHSSRNQTDSALHCFLEADKIYQFAPGGDKSIYYYVCLERIAYIYHWNLQDYASAEKYFVRAHEMFDKHLIQGQDSLLIDLRYTMSSMYRNKKEFDKARIFAMRARDLADSLQLGRQMEISRVLLSNIYSDLNNWQNARSLNERAIQINISRGGLPIDLANYYINRAFICLHLKEYAEGLGFCRKAAETLEKISRETDESAMLDQVLEQWGFHFEFKGTIYQETNQLKEADQDYTESLRLRILRYGGHHKRVAQIHQVIAKHFMLMGLPDSALYHYQQSLITGSEGFSNPALLKNPSLLQIRNNVEIIDVLREKASMLAMKFDREPENQALLRGSVDCLKLCDSLIDYVWNSYTNEEARLYLEDTAHSFYEQAVETAFRLFQTDSSGNTADDILHFMESSRYRNLSDNLTSIQAYAKTRIPETLSGSLRETEFFINYFNRKIEEDPGNTEIYNRQLLEKIRQKEQLMDSISTGYPDVAGMKNLLKSVSLDSLQKKIREKNSLVIQYFSGPRHFYILSTNGKRTAITRVEKDSALTAGLDALIKLPESDPASKPGFIRYALHSVNLYEKILKPSLDEFQSQQGDNLIIIPDGALNRISFDALLRSMPDTAYVDYKTPAYLVNHFAISYAFSSGILISASPSGRSLKRARILAMSYGVSDQAGNPYVSLEGTNRELDAIKGLTKGRFLKDQEATESAFKKYAPGYGLLHLALHGQAGLVGNDSTMLIFRNSPGDQDDGALLPEELYSLNLKASLVVLSSCESASGKSFRGEGVYSMARAFANAGCPSLVSTLWKIPDGSTVTLMTGFYGGLRKKLPPDQALRQSKMDYLRQSDPYAAHPRFWASIIPLGNF